MWIYRLQLSSRDLQLKDKLLGFEAKCELRHSGKLSVQSRKGKIYIHLSLNWIRLDFVIDLLTTATLM